MRARSQPFAFAMPGGYVNTLLRPAVRQVQTAIRADDPSTLFTALGALAEHVGRKRAVAVARRLLRRHGIRA